MSKIKYNISLDMHSSVSQASLAAKQGDDNRQFAITLRSGGQPYKIERGAFAVFSTTLPDGKVIEDNCIIADNEILYDFTQNLASQVGVLDIEIRLYDYNSKLVTSPSFILVVSPRAAAGEDIESSNSYTALDALYKNTLALKETIEGKLKDGEVANALRGAASGNALRLDDVSPAEHILKVKATGDNVSSANVVVCGKNLFGLNKSQDATYFYMENGIKVFSGTVKEAKKEYIGFDITPIWLLAYGMGLNFRISCDIKVEKAGSLRVYTLGKYAIGYSQYHNLTPEWCRLSFVGRPFISTSSSAENECVLSFFGEYDSGIIPHVKNIQIEFGETETPYEIYRGETYPINADGTVDGVTSIYPTTTLMVDIEGVILDVEYTKDTNKVIDELYAFIQGGSRISYIDLPSAKWQGSTSPYSQVVAVNGATENSKVDINPSVEQLAIFHAKDIAFVAENEDGVVTVYCIGQKPTADYQMQITITEVLANG